MHTEDADRPEIVELMKQWFAAVEARDLERMLELCDPEVRLEPFHTRRAGGPLAHEGHPGVRTWFGPLRSAPPMTTRLLTPSLLSNSVAVAEVSVHIRDPEGGLRGGIGWGVFQSRAGKLTVIAGHPSEDVARAHARRLAGRR